MQTAVPLLGRVVWCSPSIFRGATWRRGIVCSLHRS